MKRLRAASWVFGLSAILVALTLGLWPRPGAGHEDDEFEAPPGAAIELPARPIELMIELGIEDEEQVFWEGELKLSEGRLLNLELVQASINSTVDGAKFNVRTRRQPGARPSQPINRPINGPIRGAERPIAGSKTTPRSRMTNRRPPPNPAKPAPPSPTRRAPPSPARSRSPRRSPSISFRPGCGPRSTRRPRPAPKSSRRTARSRSRLKRSSPARKRCFSTARLRSAASLRRCG